MDENQFADYLKKEFPSSIELGIGDDCSIEKYGNRYLLITKDLFIEDIHFRLRYMDLFEIGKKAVAINVSDILAMGGIPKNFYLGLGIPDRFKEGDIKLFFKGIKEGCLDWNIELAGGDISRAEQFFISITLKGDTQKPILRKNAKVGDLICLSDKIGEASVGLELFEKNKINLEDDGVIYFKERFKFPPINIEKARKIAKYANSMIDLSDGFLMDLKRILKASDKGARIYFDKFPKDRRILMVCNKYKINIQEKILAGGEDYVLLFSIPKNKSEILTKMGIQFYNVGEVTQVRELKIFSKGQEIKPKLYGFDHFKKR